MLSMTVLVHALALVVGLNYVCVFPQIGLIPDNHDIAIAKQVKT